MPPALFRRRLRRPLKALRGLEATPSPSTTTMRDYKRGFFQMVFVILCFMVYQAVHMIHFLLSDEALYAGYPHLVAAFAELDAAIKEQEEKDAMRKMRQRRKIAEATKMATTNNETFAPLKIPDDIDKRISKLKFDVKGNPIHQDPEDPSVADKPKPLVYFASKRQMIQMRNTSLALLYDAALFRIDNATFRAKVDPLGEKRVIRNSNANRVDFHPQVEYLGVLIDAGRYFFPIDWLKRLIVYLHQLHFNLIHFRLTDDQAFNVQLESYPELAFAAPTSTYTTYTPKELRELVAFAKLYEIVIIPEINVPGHSGAWAGIPNLVMDCPEFACEAGYGIPLNVEHPNLKTILKQVLVEVLDIFENPPFLHLGGDEVHKSMACFEEVDEEPFNYTGFEHQLKEILREIEYPESQVIRWEVTGPNAAKEILYRAGDIQHNWYNLPGQKQTVLPNQTFFTSWRLYMDLNHNEGGERIYEHAKENLQCTKEKKFQPRGLIATAFELDPEFWILRNVAARLIAVAMGASQLEFTDSQHFREVYDLICVETLGLHPKVCDLQGFTATTEEHYLQLWSRTWEKWKHGICERMTSKN
jgi:hypothetical protein